MDDLVANVGIVPVEIGFQQLVSVSETALKHGLDFDDAYQYAVAETSGLEIVSFDSDFDGTPKGRIPPGDKRLASGATGSP